MKYFLFAFILCIPFTGFAHPGKLNSEGCHNNKSTGTYECHEVKEKKEKKVKKSAKKVSTSAKKTVTTSDYNCSDFSSQAEAQKVFIKAVGPKSDPYDLDRDKDEIACEELTAKKSK